MKYLKLILNFIPQHKYLITLLIFGLIIGVLDDENSLITRAKHASEDKRTESGDKAVSSAVRKGQQDAEGVHHLARCAGEGGARELPHEKGE